jgi:hypothetical protein
VTTAYPPSSETLGTPDPLHTIKANRKITKTKNEDIYINCDDLFDRLSKQE